MISTIILCRQNSSRLPNKHFKLIHNKMLIEIILIKLYQIDKINEIFIASGPQKKNYLFEKKLKKKFPKLKYYYHNDEDNVTERVNVLTQKINNKFTLLISGDCPLIEKNYINFLYSKLLRNNNSDFTLPKKGNVLEGIILFKTNAWKDVYDFSSDKIYREHPGHILKKKKEKFKIHYFNNFGILKNIPKKIRLSVDTRSDLDFQGILFSFSRNNIKKYNLNLLNKYQYLKKINHHVTQVNPHKINNKEAIFITHFSKRYGLGHLKRILVLVREYSEKINQNYKIILINSPKKNIYENLDKKKIFNKTSLNKLYIKKKIIIIDLPEDYLQTSSNNLLNNNRFLIIDKIINHKNCINIIPSLLSIKKKKNIFSGKKFLILNREINYVNLNNNKVKDNKILILSGGTSMFPNEILNYVKKNGKKKFILVAGPLLNKKYISSLKKNFTVLHDPKNYFQLIKTSKKVICRYGVSTYEIMALGHKPIVWEYGEDNNRIGEIKKLKNKNMIHIFNIKKK